MSKPSSPLEACFIGHAKGFLSVAHLARCITPEHESVRVRAWIGVLHSYHGASGDRTLVSSSTVLSETTRNPRFLLGVDLGRTEAGSAAPSFVLLLNHTANRALNSEGTVRSGLQTIQTAPCCSWAMPPLSFSGRQPEENKV